MVALTGTFSNGSIQLDRPPKEWAEGDRVEVQPIARDEIGGMTEEEQGDDPATVARWIEELNAIPPLSMTEEEEAELLAWRKKVKEFNLEAVRRQFEEGIVGAPR